MFENLGAEAKAFIFKIIVPATVAVSIKLAVMSKEKKITFFQIVSSFVTGIGTAYLSAPLVIQYTSPNSLPLVIAALTISGEKIGHYFIFKFHVEEFLRGLLDKVFKK